MITCIRQRDLLDHWKETINNLRTFDASMHLKTPLTSHHSIEKRILLAVTFLLLFKVAGISLQATESSVGVFEITIRIDRSLAITRGLVFVVVRFSEFYAIPWLSTLVDFPSRRRARSRMRVCGEVAKIPEIFILLCETGFTAAHSVKLGDIIPVRKDRV